MESVRLWLSYQIISFRLVCLGIHSIEATDASIKMLYTWYDAIPRFNQGNSTGFALNAKRWASIREVLCKYHHEMSRHLQKSQQVPAIITKKILKHTSKAVKKLQEQLAAEEDQYNPSYGQGQIQDLILGAG